MSAIGLCTKKKGSAVGFRQRVLNELHEKDAEYAKTQIE